MLIDQGAKFEGVQGLYPSDCSETGVGSIGGVADGMFVKSTKSYRLLGSVARRQMAEGPINRFSTNSMAAV